MLKAHYRLLFLAPSTGIFCHRYQKAIIIPFNLKGFTFHHLWYLSKGSLSYRELSSNRRWGEAVLVLLKLWQALWPLRWKKFANRPVQSMQKQQGCNSNKAALLSLFEGSLWEWKWIVQDYRDLRNCRILVVWIQFERICATCIYHG